MILYIIKQIEVMINRLLMFLYTMNAEVHDGIHGGCVLCVCDRPPLSILLLAGNWCVGIY